MVEGTSIHNLRGRRGAQVEVWEGLGGKERQSVASNAKEEGCEGRAEGEGGAARGAGEGTGRGRQPQGEVRAR